MLGAISAWLQSTGATLKRRETAPASGECGTPGIFAPRGWCLFGILTLPPEVSLLAATWWPWTQCVDDASQSCCRHGLWNRLNDAGEAGGVSANINWEVKMPPAVACMIHGLVAAAII